MPGPFTMSQQAQNDFYKDEAEMALDYAAAVNAEIRDLFAAGADIVQIDEPYMQARPEKARQFGLAAVNRALEGVVGTTALHICFGYAAIIHSRPSGYSFLPEFADTPLKQISIETAQSNLDTSMLAKLPGKTIILGVIDLNDMTVETPETVAEPHPQGAPLRSRREDHRRSRLRHEVPAARRRLRQDAGDGRRRGDRAEGSRRPAAGLREAQFDFETGVSTALPVASAAGASASGGSATGAAADGARKACGCR